MSFSIPSRKNIINLASLGVIQAANAILPLAIFPFVLHIVGIERFADIVLTESISLISLGVILYSFDIDGIRRFISIKSDQIDERHNCLFYSIFWTRLFLYAIVSTIILIGVFFVYRKVILLQLSWLLFPLGQILQSAWFFQVTERNLFVGISNSALRLACAVLIYFIIDTPEKYVYVPLLIGGSYFFSGIIAFLYANYCFGMRLRFSSTSDIRNLLIQGWHIFAGNISVILFRGSNVIILKALSADSAVSAYSVAEKIVKCAQAATRPLNQFAYPKVAYKFKEPGFYVKNSIKLITKYTLPQIVFLLVFYTASVLAYFLALEAGFSLSTVGNDVLLLLAIMAPATFLGICNFMFGTAGLNSLGLDRPYARAIVFTGIISLANSAILIAFSNAVGASCSFVLGEALLLFFILRIFRKLKQEDMLY